MPKQANHIDGLVKGCSISIFNTPKVQQSCTHPSMYWLLWFMTIFVVCCQFLSVVRIISPSRRLAGGTNVEMTSLKWRGALMFSLICAWINDWVNNREAGDLRRHCAHYDVIAMSWFFLCCTWRLYISVLDTGTYIHRAQTRLNSLFSTKIFPK